MRILSYLRDYESLDLTNFDFAEKYQIGRMRSLAIDEVTLFE